MSHTERKRRKIQDTFAFHPFVVHFFTCYNCLIVSSNFKLRDKELGNPSKPLKRPSRAKKTVYDITASYAIWFLPIPNCMTNRLIVHGKVTKILTFFFSFFPSLVELGYIQKNCGARHQFKVSAMLLFHLGPIWKQLQFQISQHNVLQICLFCGIYDLIVLLSIFSVSDKVADI